MKAWETARLEFLKHLKMRGNIPTVKEALGEHEHNQRKILIDFALQLTAGRLFQAQVSINTAILHSDW